MNPVARGRSQVGSQYYGVLLESAQEWLFLSCCQMILLWDPESSPIILNVFLSSLLFKEWCEMKSTTDLDGGRWTETSLCKSINQIAIELYMDFADEHSCWHLGCSSDYQCLVHRDQTNLVHSAPGLLSSSLVIHPILALQAAHSNMLCSWRDSFFLEKW